MPNSRLLSESLNFFIDGKHEFDLIDAGIKLKHPDKSGDLEFEISTDATKISLKLELFTKDGIKDYAFKVLDGKRATVRYKSVEQKISEFFYDHRPVVYFFDGSSLEGNLYTELIRIEPPYDKRKILIWDWKSIDIKKESQGLTKEKDSIQFLVISRLKKKDYDFIFNDDDAGEAADVLAIKTVNKVICVEFYHCKYSKGNAPGARISDLYEVCGQAQKSIRWMEKLYTRPKELFTHMLRREHNRTGKDETSRIEKGSLETLHILETQSSDYPIQLKVFIVQPGLSRNKVTQDQLELLGVTENHLKQTYGIDFGVIAS